MHALVIPIILFPSLKMKRRLELCFVLSIFVLPLIVVETTPIGSPEARHKRYIHEEIILKVHQIKVKISQLIITFFKHNF